MRAVGYVVDGETVPTSKFVLQFITGRVRLMCLIESSFAALQSSVRRIFFPDWSHFLSVIT